MDAELRDVTNNSAAVDKMLTRCSPQFNKHMSVFDTAADSSVQHFNFRPSWTIPNPSHQHLQRAVTDTAKPNESAVSDLVVKKSRQAGSQRKVLRKSSRTNEPIKPSFTHKTSKLIVRTVSKMLPSARKSTAGSIASTMVTDISAGPSLNSDAFSRKSSATSTSVSMGTPTGMRIGFQDGHAESNGGLEVICDRAKNSPQPPPIFDLLPVGSVRKNQQKLTSNHGSFATPSTIVDRNPATSSTNKKKNVKSQIVPSGIDIQKTLKGGNTESGAGRVHGRFHGSYIEKAPNRDYTPSPWQSVTMQSPVLAILELSQRVIPCFKPVNKAKNTMWLLVDIKCTPSCGTSTGASISLQNAGILRNLNFDFYIPSGFETLTYCGAVTRSQMTTSEQDNIWSVAICIGSSHSSAGGLKRRLTTTVSSTVSMIDGFLKVLRADSHLPSTTAVQYRVNTMHSFFPASHSLTVLKYCTLPTQFDKKVASQNLDDVQASINRVIATAERDDIALSGLIADFERWKRSRQTGQLSRQVANSAWSRYSSLLPRPLSFKAKVGNEEPAYI